MAHTHVGPSGAKFTPKATSVTIAQMEATGEWKKIPVAPRKRKAANGDPDSSSPPPKTED